MWLMPCAANQGRDEALRSESSADSLNRHTDHGVDSRWNASLRAVAQNLRRENAERPGQRVQSEAFC